MGLVDTDKFWNRLKEVAKEWAARDHFPTFEEAEAQVAQVAARETLRKLPMDAVGFYAREFQVFVATHWCETHPAKKDPETEPNTRESV
jgi:hypothetical protein